MSSMLYYVASQAFCLTLNKCSIQDGVLCNKDRLWVPESMYAEIIRESHDQLACGHPGMARTYELLEREYYWRDMETKVPTYVRYYYASSRTKAPRDRGYSLLKPLAIRKTCWQVFLWTP